MANSKTQIGNHTKARPKNFSSQSEFQKSFIHLSALGKDDFSDKAPLSVSWINTPLGSMFVVCDDRLLHVLEFTSRSELSAELQKLKKVFKQSSGLFRFAETNITRRLRRELNRYFSLQDAGFSVDVAMHCSPFTRKVWQALLEIPAGQTISYSEVAIAVGNPAAVRAAARANGANPIAIIVPCHRVVGADGSLTGYGGGLWRKQALIDLERNFSTSINK